MDREVEDEKKLKQGGLIILKVGFGGLGWGGVITMNKIMQKQSNHNGLENYKYP